MRFSSLYRLAFILALAIIAPCSLLHAQREVPHRDFAKVDSTNSGKVNPPVETVIKKGYSIISKEDGLYYQQHLETYIRDTLGLGTVQIDSIIYDGDIDSLCFYMPDTMFCTYLPAGISVGTEDQIPFVNATDDDLEYSDQLKWVGDTLKINTGFFHDTTPNGSYMVFTNDFGDFDKFRVDLTSAGWPDVYMSLDPEEGFFVTPDQASGHAMYMTPSIFAAGVQDADIMITGTGNSYISDQHEFIVNSSIDPVVHISNSQRVGINDVTPSQTLDVNGTTRITGSSGVATTLAGRDGDGDVNAVTAGDGLLLEDNVLSLISTPGDSVIMDTTLGVCVISMGDTLCSDSVYFDIEEQEICVIIDGDTTCASYSNPVINLATTDLIQTDDVRTYDLLLGQQLQFRRAAPPFGTIAPVFRIMPHDNSANIRIDAFTTNPVVSTLALQNWSTDGDIFLHWNGQSAQDYVMGIDASRNAFVFGEGSELSTPFFDAYSLGDSISFRKDIQINAGLLDKDGDIGSAGMLLSSDGDEVNWISSGAFGIPISSLDAAIETNVIDNLNYAQEWQWTTLNTAALTLQTNSTAASGSNQRLLGLTLAGANVNSAAATYGIHISNTHTGTLSLNYGISATASGGSGANIGVQAIGLGSVGIGLHGSSDSGTGITAGADTGLPMLVTDNSTATNDAQVMISIERGTSGTAGNGIGGIIEWKTETSTGSSQVSNLITSKWTTATHASRTSQMIISGVNSTTTNEIMYLEGDKRLRMNGRLQEKMGANVASANDLTLGYDGNSFHITGTTQINAITTTDWQNGSIIRLVFDGSLTVKDNTTGGGSTAPIQLASSVDFAATADDILTLMLDSTRWLEVSRSAN